MSLTKTPHLAETVRKLLARGASANAFNILSRLHPSDIAELFGELPNYRKVAFELLIQRNLSLAGETLSELGHPRGGDLLAGMSVQEISQVLQELDPDDAAEFVGQLPPELQEEILGAMRKKDAAEVEDLLKYPEQTAGRIMNPNVFSLSEDTTVGESIARLQKNSADLEMVFYIYAVDNRNHLVGVLSLRQLIQKRPEIHLKDIMATEVIRVAADTDQEEVAQLVARYNLLAIPVVDSENKLVGFIPVDDVIDVIKEEATEDMYRLAGLDVSEHVFSPPRTSVRMRIPWLVVNLATAFLAAFVVSLFEDTIRQFAVLAVFMPIVPLLGGNAGIQTLTVMVRGIALGELRWSNSRQALLKEVMVGAVNGIVIGLIVALLALLWKGCPILGLVLGLSMVGTLLVAAVTGTLVPLALRWLNVDPALASSVFVTTCTDVFGFLSFLGLGTYLLTRFT